jgi:hypothetical protein
MYNKPCKRCKIPDKKCRQEKLQIMPVGKGIQPMAPEVTVEHPGTLVL